MPSLILSVLLAALAFAQSDSEKPAGKKEQISRQRDGSYNVVFADLNIVLLGGVRFTTPSETDKAVRGSVTLDLYAVIPTTMNSYDTLPGFGRKGRLGSVTLEIAIVPFGKTTEDIEGTKAAILSAFVEFEEKGANFAALPEDAKITGVSAFESKRVELGVRSLIRQIRSGRIKPRSGDRLQFVYDAAGNRLEKIFVEPGTETAHARFTRPRSPELKKAQLIALEPVFTLSALKLHDAIEGLESVISEPNSTQYDLRKTALVASDLEFRLRRFYDETLLEVTTESENEAENSRRDVEHAMEPTSSNSVHSRYWKNKTMLDELAAMTERLGAVSKRALRRSCEVLVRR